MLHLQLMCENERATPRVKANTDSPGQRHAVEVTNHKTHGPVPAPGSVGIAKVTQVMAKIASAGIMCIGQKSVCGKLTDKKRSCLLFQEEFFFVPAVMTRGITILVRHQHG